MAPSRCRPKIMPIKEGAPPLRTRYFESLCRTPPPVRSAHEQNNLIERVRLEPPDEKRRTRRVSEGESQGAAERRRGDRELRRRAAGSGAAAPLATRRS